MDAVARDVPATATSRYVVLAFGFTVRDPFAGTRPMPLSTSTDSAPSTAQDRVVTVPGSTSAGTAMKRWMARGLSVSATGLTNWQPNRATTTPTPQSAAPRDDGRRIRMGVSTKNTSMVATYVAHVKSYFNSLAPASPPGSISASGTSVGRGA